MTRRAVYLPLVAAILSTGWLTAQPAQGSMADEFRMVEVASVSDAMEQLYGQRAYMSHEMRPLAPAKFAGPAVTVLLKKEEHKEGSAASQGMLDAIDESPAGSVYVMVVDRGTGAPGVNNEGGDYAGIGGLMATAMKYRGFAGAGIDPAFPATPRNGQPHFPLFNRGVARSTNPHP